MAKIDEKIKQNAKELKNDTYGKNMADKAKGYTTGAIVGGISGFCAGYFLIKGKLVLSTIVGVILGGYIGYKVAEESQVTQDFNFKAPKT